MTGISSQDAFLVNEANSILFIKCRSEDGSPFYAYVQSTPDTLRRLKIAQEHQRKLDMTIGDIGNILYYGFEEDPPEDIRALFHG